MSDIHLHGDLYQEAAIRRSRDVDGWVRAEGRRRAARRTSSRGRRPGARFIDLVSRGMDLAGAFVATSTQRTRSVVRRHSH